MIDKIDKYLDEGVISSKDPRVFKNIVHTKIKNQYDEIKWAIKSMDMDNMSKKRWFEVAHFLDKALEKIVTI